MSIHLIAPTEVRAYCGAISAAVLAYDVSVVTCDDCLEAYETHKAALSSRTNPILRHARGVLPEYRADHEERWFFDSMLLSLKAADGNPKAWANTIATPDQIEHAKRVLSKLAAIS